jgi:hypothetical protein
LGFGVLKAAKEKEKKVKLVGWRTHDALARWMNRTAENVAFGLV